MLCFCIETEQLIISDVRKEELDEILKLYNENDQAVYATGIDRKLTIEDINQKYMEVLINSHEFFSTVRFRGCDDIAAVLKGRIDYENAEEAWISSLFIAEKYRGTGKGKVIVNTVINYMNDTYDIKKVLIGAISDNEEGKIFWHSLGFKNVRTIEKYIELKGVYKDFIIMGKEINK